MSAEHPKVRDYLRTAQHTVAYIWRHTCVVVGTTATWPAAAAGGSAAA